MNEETSQIWIFIYVQIFFRWEKDVMENKFHQINKGIISNYVVKNKSLRK